MAPPPRPAIVRRLAAGAWHLPHALVVFVRTPSLWGLGVPAALVGGFFINLGAVGGAFLVPRVEHYLAPAPGSVAPWLDIAFTLTLWLGGLGSGALLGFACGMALVAPLLDLVSQRRDQAAPASAPIPKGRLALESMKGSLLLLAVSALTIPASLAPLTGPFLGVVLAGALLGARGMASALVRRGLGLRARLAWFRTWLPETTGFGFAALVVLLVPGLNFLLAPALWIGGTDLVSEITEWAASEEEGPGAPQETDTADATPQAGEAKEPD